MSESQPHDASLDRSNRIDQICDQFEQNLQAGKSPRIENILAAQTDVDHDRLLRELLLIELEVRRSNGEAPSAADYTSRFPEQADVVDAALETIATRVTNPNETNSVDISFHSADETYVPSDPAKAETIVHGTGTEPAQSSSSEPGSQQFGDYELLHEIARGGMGVVYKARQTKLNRIVALKMIKSGELAGEEEIQRFHTEAEAAAALDHPNIVPIHEVGESQGRGASSPVHFFSMGFVDGSGLDSRLKDGPLPPKEAAVLIKTIAEAVQYAHEKGIVHRDLKPANVLIDADGNPKITDFGLAKNIAGDSGMTATGQVMGTPSYMPPEQAAGNIEQIGAISDVYSLGAMLYATLTGRPPFQAANVMETLKQVLEREPVSPRTLNPSVDKDLETICLKCLEKQSTQRYPSARTLADDLRRFINREPITARPVGRIERCWRWCRRNPGLSSIGGAALVLLATLAIGGPIMAATQSRLKQDAIEESNRAKDALAREQIALRKVTAALEKNEQTIYQWVQTTKNAQLLKDPRFKPLLKDLLKHALAHYKQFIENNKDDQSFTMRARIARALYEVGAINYASGSFDESMQAYQSAQLVLSKLRQEDPTAEEILSDLANIHNNIGTIDIAAGRHGEALTAFESALKMFEDLAHKHPGNSLHLHDLGGAHENLGSLYSDSGRADEALVSFKKALVLRKQLVRKYPDDATHRKRLARCFDQIGILYSRMRRTVDAHDAYRQALGIYEKLVREQPGDDASLFRLASCQNNLSVLYSEMRRTSDALKVARRALPILDRLARENPTMTAYQNVLALCLNNIGLQCDGTGRRAEAMTAYQKARKIREQLALEYPNMTDNSVGLGGLYCNLALLDRRRGKDTQAFAWYQRAVTLLGDVNNREPQNFMAARYLQNTYLGRAQLLDRHSRYREAASDWKRASELANGKTRIVLQRRQFLSLARSGQYAESMNLATQLLNVTTRDPDRLCDIARGLAISATAARRDGTLDPKQRDRFADRFSSMSLSLLKSSSKMGFLIYFRIRKLVRTDDEFNSLRHRDDFRKFAKSLNIKLPAWARKPNSALIEKPPRPIVAPKPKAHSQQR